MAQFQYVRISEALIDQLVDEVSRGESAVLLGPHMIGKRYVLARVAKGLADEGTAVMGVTDFHKDTVHSALNQVGQGEHLPSDSAKVLTWVDRHINTVQGRVVLLAANVDKLSPQLARRFLAGIRTRLQQSGARLGNLMVVLTGEMDLRNLVHGPTSEFNCAHHYVLQGFDEEALAEFARRYVCALGIDINRFITDLPGLCQRTGGNPYLFRLLMWADFELIMLQQAGAGTHSELPQGAQSQTPLAFLVTFLRHALALIACEPESWRRLEALLKGQSVKVQGNAPELLELTAVAIRTGEELRIASPLLQELLEDHCTPRWFADRYARFGDWEEAFCRYRNLSPAERVRYGSVDELAETEMLVNWLVAAMQSAAATGSKEVHDLFESACKYVFGVSHISFWLDRQGWKLQGDSQVSSAERIRREILPSRGYKIPSVLQLSFEHQARVIAAIIPTEHLDYSGAIVIGDLEADPDVGPIGWRLLSELVASFVSAYDRAVTIERERHRLELQEQYGKILSNIIASLGSTVLNPGDVLKQAADGLRRVGYCRVLFYLVNEQGTDLRAVIDTSEGPSGSVDVTKMKAWSLDDPKRNVLTFAIHHRRPVIVEDAEHHPLIDKDAVEQARTKTFVVVPLLTPGNTAIGAVQVECPDDQVPIKKDVEELLSFCGQLVITLEHATRGSMLQETLDHLPEPILICDARERVRFANQPMADLFGFPHGWQMRDNASSSWCVENFHPRLKHVAKNKAQLRESLRRGQRLVSRVEARGAAAVIRNAAVLTDVIRNWLGEPAGAFCHVRDLDYLFGLLDALDKAQQAYDTNEAIHTILAAARAMGSCWGRLWLISSDEPPHLVSKASFGIADLAYRAAFNGGKETLPAAAGDDDESWLCIKKRSPQVFCLLPDHPDGERVLTALGLEAINVHRPKCPPGIVKKPGDYWIDFPLLTKTTVLGKLTLYCDEDYPPEDFEFLKVLCLILKDLLEASSRWQQALAERTEWIAQAAQRATADAAHNLGSSIRALPLLLGRYQQLAHDVDLSRLNDLNADLEGLCQHLSCQLDHAKDRLAPVVACRTRTKLGEFFRRVLRSVLHESMWQVGLTDENLEADIDPDLLSTAMLELVHNSRQCSRDSAGLRVHVTATTKVCSGGPFLMLTYEDNGPGVSAELRERVFEDFYSCHPGGRRSTGLGLGYVRRVAQAHDGNVCETGQPGCGARFVMEFPQFVPQQQD